ncbi:PAS domain S-box protein [Flavobacterium ajazii]|uniref:PAS domain S-box protein n=1 Tax=Flavobacterium ajazii TaxID=2692318 RepID=UPI0013D7F0C4|nr:PAS domain S-box protein [Flavobacterium ajazii]
MQKNSFPYRILIIDDNPQRIKLVNEWIHDWFYSPEISTANFKNVIEIITVGKSDIILIAAERKSQIDTIRTIEKSINGTVIIVISDSITISDSADLQITPGSNNMLDFLPKKELTSLLLYKSILYTTEKNKIDIRYTSLKRKYNNLFEMNPVPMWIYNLESLKFWRVNEAAVRKYGYTKEEFLKMSIKDIRPEEDLAKLEKTINLIRKHNKLFSNGIYRHIKKDGTILYVEIVSNIIYIDKVKYSLVLANDITETLNYIQAIESQNAKLQEIAFSHSHVIRAPLTNIMGILNLIREMDLSSPESAELLEYLSTSCDLLDEKISEVVKMSTAYPLPESKSKV